MSDPGQEPLAISQDLLNPLFPIGQGQGPAPGNALVGSAPQQILDPLGLIEKYESGGRNVLNYMYDKTHTAGGYYQITNSTWRDIAPKAGIDLGLFPTAISAPKEVQRQAAAKLFEERGWSPWALYNPALARAIGMAPRGGNELVDVKPAAGMAEPAGAKPAPGPLATVPGLDSGAWQRLLGLSMLAQSLKPQAPVQVSYDPKRGITEAGPGTTASREPSLLGALPGETLIPKVDYGIGKALPAAPRPVTAAPGSPVAQYLTKVGMRSFWAGQD
jgi:hypothetical protein